MASVSKAKLTQRGYINIDLSDLLIVFFFMAGLCWWLISLACGYLWPILKGFLHAITACAPLKRSHCDRLLGWHCCHLRCLLVGRL